jgi:uncharacterized phosphatase
MKALYFARHGESEANKNMVFAGTWDVPLTEVGRSQAQKEGEQAKSIRIDYIVSSPLIRAHETARIIANAIGYPEDDILLSDLLIERSYGELQQKPYSAIDGIVFNDTPGLETDEQLLTRGNKAARLIRALPYDSVLIISHATFGRVLRDCILDQRSEIEVPIEDELPNAQIIKWI